MYLVTIPFHTHSHFAPIVTSNNEFTIVQILEANIIFPFAVGNRLKINTLAIIIVIIVGGILWGAAGMILFIPFLSIVKLIADRTESLKTLSLLLGSEKTTK